MDTPSSLDFLGEIPRLTEEDVHLWSFSFPSLVSHLEQFQSYLSAAERKRIAKIINLNFKQQHIISRGLLRHLLAFYLGKKPADIEIILSLNGKPALRAADNLENFTFNVSHSLENILIAVGKNQDLGVDIEYVNGRTEIDNLIPAICSTREQNYLRANPNDKSVRDYFFYLWTRKEALLKNTGEGITVDLTHYDVTMASEKQHPIASKIIPIERGIVLHSLKIGQAYWASIAKKGAINNLFLWVSPNIVAGFYTSQSPA